MVNELGIKEPAEKDGLGELLLAGSESVAQLSEVMVRESCLSLNMHLVFAEKRRKTLKKACR
tara:strand:+ start:719 stop:904 length:186 start_codon:yes stop_codon:yes gene_type:complete